MDIIKNWSLQMFAEGGEGAAAPGGNEGEAQSTAENAQEQTEQKKMSFDELLKDADYAKEFEKRVSRRAGYETRKAVQAERQKYLPMHEAMARKYGMDPGKIDMEKLSEKVLGDNDLLEQEAAEMGVSVDGLRMIRNAERQLQEAEAIRAEQEKERAFAQIVAEGEALKQIYPGFNLEAELQDPRFGNLLAGLQSAGFGDAVRTAYESVHRDEIMSGAMQYAVQRTKQQVSNNIQAGMNRPAENGGTQAAAQTRIDPSRFNRQQIEEIRKRVSKGEIITFR